MKLNVGVIFGGKSLEHEKSILTATQVMKNLNPDKYNIIPIYIDKNNNFYAGYHFKDLLNYRDIALVLRYAKKVNLIKQKNNYILQTTGLLKYNYSYVDLVIPCGLGNYVSDGHLQGYLDMLGIPYTGSGVLSSAISKDKIVFKDILKGNDIPTTSYVWFYKEDFLSNRKKVLEKIEDNLKYPMYVKPATLGSSIGVALVDSSEELIKEIKKIIEYDQKVLVEEKIKNTKEVSISIIGNNKDQEISDIYENDDEEVSDDYFNKVDKYLNEQYSKYFKINSLNKKNKPLISKEMKDDIKKYAKDIFNVLNIRGIAQIDFLIDERNLKIFVSKIRTIPYGMSNVIWKKNKKSEQELLDDLIKIAINKMNDDKNIIKKVDGNLLEGFDLKINKQ